MRRSWGLSTLLAWVSLTGQAPMPEVKSDPFQADLAYLRAQLPLAHPNPFKWRSQAAFELDATHLQRTLEGLDPRGKTVCLAALVAAMKDGHSFLEGYFPILGFSPETYPLRLYAFADGIHVQATAKTHARMLGARVVSLNGVPIREALARVAPLVPAENAQSEKAWAVYGLTAPEVLRAFGLMEGRGPAVYELAWGDRRERIDLAGTQVRQPVEAFGQVDDPLWVRADARGSSLLRNRHPKEAYWWAFEPDSGTFYVQFNEVRNQGKVDLPSFFREVARQVAKVPMERFVLDLRRNPGGETGMNDEIVRTMLGAPGINRPDRFLVLIGRRTFSSAQLICTALDRYSEARFIGEPSGIRTHFFANTRKRLTLPHTRLGVFLSTSWWQPTNPRELEPHQRPDLEVEETSEDYLQGRDPVLEAALGYPKPTPSGGAGAPEPKP